MLPRPELRHAGDDGNDERRRDQRREQMIGAVPRGAVMVVVAVVLREDPFQQLGEVGLGTVAELEDGKAGGCVRDEHVKEPVAGTGAETAYVVGEIDELASAGIELELDRSHESMFAQPVRPRGWPSGV